MADVMESKGIEIDPVKKKLIELLQNAPADFEGNHGVSALADHLIANGVTVTVTKPAAYPRNDFINLFSAINLQGDMEVYRASQEAERKGGVVTHGDVANIIYGFYYDSGVRICVTDKDVRSWGMRSLYDPTQDV